MKMSNALFSELKADFNTIRDSFIAAGKITAETDLSRNLWDFFHAVSFDRMNDDTHPAFQNRIRRLPFWSRNGESRDMQGNDNWLNRFYDEENLNDTHIDTAMRAILKEWKGA